MSNVPTIRFEASDVAQAATLAHKLNQFQANVAAQQQKQASSTQTVAWSQITGIPATFPPTPQSFGWLLGTINPGQVPSNVVTQYQGDLEIDWEQIVGAPTILTEAQILAAVGNAMEPTTSITPTTVNGEYYWNVNPYSLPITDLEQTGAGVLYGTDIDGYPVEVTIGTGLTLTLGVGTAVLGLGDGTGITAADVSYDDSGTLYSYDDVQDAMTFMDAGWQDQYNTAGFNQRAQISVLGTLATDGTLDWTIDTGDGWTQGAVNQAFDFNWTGVHTFTPSENDALSQTQSAVTINGITGNPDDNVPALTVNVAQGQYAGWFQAANVSGNSYGMVVIGGTTADDTAFAVCPAAYDNTYLNINGDGSGWLNALFFENDGAFSLEFTNFTIGTDSAYTWAFNPDGSLSVYGSEGDEGYVLTSGGSGQPASWQPASGGSSLTVTDGTNTVDDVTQITFSGATVSGSTPDATVTITGGGSGTVTSVGVSITGDYAAAITAGGTNPVTSSGTIDLEPNVFTSDSPGVVPESGGGTTNYLRADGSWDAPVGTTYSAGTGLTLTDTTFSIADNAITNALLEYDSATVTAGTGLSGGGTLTLGSSVTLTNSGVTEAIAGTGIGVSAATGNVTITNDGVTSIAGTSDEITASASTGSVTLSIPDTFLAPGTIQDTSGMLYSTSAAVSAAGSSQGTATALTASYNVVTTVGSGQGVALPTAVKGLRCVVINLGANALSVYPASGGTIDSASENAAVSLAVKTCATYEASSSTQWYTVDQPLVAGTAISLTPGNGGITVANTGVTSLAGTSDEIDVSASTGSVTISIDANYAGQTSITTVGTIGTGTWAGTAIAVAHGGTGETSALAAFNNLANVSPAEGDILYYTGSAWAVLAAGSNTNLLTLSSGVPAWEAVPTWNQNTTGTAAGLSTTLAVSSGGTGETTALAAFNNLANVSPAQGDILYYNGSAWVVLAPGTSGYFLQTQGASANPLWAAAGGGSGPTYQYLSSAYTSTSSFVDIFPGITTTANTVYLIECLVVMTTSETPVWEVIAPAGSTVSGSYLVNNSGTPELASVTTINSSITGAAAGTSGSTIWRLVVVTSSTTGTLTLAGKTDVSAFTLGVGGYISIVAL